MNSVRDTIINPTPFNKVVASSIAILAITAIAIYAIGLAAPTSLGITTTHKIFLGTSIFVLILDLVWIAALKKEQDFLHQQKRLSDREELDLARQGAQRRKREFGKQLVDLYRRDRQIVVVPPEKFQRVPGMMMAQVAPPVMMDFDALSVVASYLDDLEDLGSLQQVCRQWRDVGRDKGVRKHVLGNEINEINAIAGVYGCTIDPTSEFAAIPGDSEKWNQETEKIVRAFKRVILLQAREKGWRGTFVAPLRIDN